jgi:hypothetical protein
MADDYKKMKGMGAKEKDRYSMGKGERSMLKDNAQASSVYPIATMTEDSDMGRMRYHPVGDKGYARQAFDYDY